MIVVECPYEPHHTHEYPDDWQFGGASEVDPRADPRWKPSTYVYYDHRILPIHITQVPLCDDEAIDRFTEVAGYGPDYNPVWISVRRPDGVVSTLKVNYDKATDEVTDT